MPAMRSQWEVIHDGRCFRIVFGSKSLGDGLHFLWFSSEASTILHRFNQCWIRFDRLLFTFPYLSRLFCICCESDSESQSMWGVFPVRKMEEPTSNHISFIDLFMTIPSLRAHPPLNFDLVAELKFLTKHFSLQECTKL